jgi:hypothetical protein
MLWPLPFITVGEGEHRSGWPYCLESLQPLFNDDSPVIFDDFIERSFLYDVELPYVLRHKQPWVGCIHHPPDMPSGYMDYLHLQNLATNERWLSSLPSLKLLITFAPNSAKWCRKQWPDIPVVVVKHPTGRPFMYWSPERFRRNAAKKLLQIGWFLRNTMAIYNVAAPAEYQKIHVQQDYHFVKEAHAVCEAKQKTWYPDRQLIGSVVKQASTCAIDYDLLLAENVVFVELLSAVANNTVIECIARNTPICLNRHPGPVYYLGKDYPLFFDDLNDVPYLLTEQNVLAAHHYLKTLDKWWIRGGMFREQIREVCLSHVADCKQTEPMKHQTLFSI